MSYINISRDAGVGKIYYNTTNNKWSPSAPTAWKELKINWVEATNANLLYWFKIVCDTDYKNPHYTKSGNSVTWTTKTYSETTLIGYLDYRALCETKLNFTTEQTAALTLYCELHAKDTNGNNLNSLPTTISTTNSKSVTTGGQTSITTTISMNNPPSYYWETLSNNIWEVELTRIAEAWCWNGISDSTDSKFGSCTQTGNINWIFENATSKNSWNALSKSVTEKIVNAGERKSAYTDNYIKAKSYNTTTASYIGSVTTPGTNKYSRTGYYYTQWINGSTKYNANSKVNLYWSDLTASGTNKYWFKPVWIANDLSFIGGSKSVTCSTSAQTFTINAATNGTGSYTYSISAQTNSNGSTVNYFSISGTTITIPGNTRKDTYTITVHVVDNNSKATADTTWTLTLSPLTNSLTIDPSSDYTLSYTGKAQQLVTSCKVTGGAAYVGISTSSTTAPTTWYTDLTKATATDVGTYYVWAKVDGGNNYADISPAYKFKVEIKPAIKVYDNNKWNPSTSVKVYNGSKWVEAKAIKIYNGSKWVDAK